MVRRSAIAVPAFWALLLAAACIPDLRGRSCANNTECLVTETCVEARCVPSGGEGDDPQIDVGLTLDGGDDADLPEETDGTDLAPSDGGDRPDAGSECASPYAPFTTSVSLVAYEPCSPESPAWPGCRPSAMAYSGGGSSWERVDEPIELPLLNGWLNDGDIQLTFDGTLDGPGVDNGVESPDPETASFVEGFDGRPEGALELSDQSFLAGLELDSSRGFTVTFYLRPDASMNADIFAFIAHLSAILRYADGSLTVRIGDGSRDVSVSTPRELPVGDWAHIALAVPRAAAPSLYIDGRAVEMGWAEGARELETSSIEVAMGFDTDTHMTIDDLVLFQRLLSEQEVSVLVESGRPFGTPLIETQADFDDLRLVRVDNGEATEIPFELVGRRPFPDSESFTHHWQFNGDLVDRADPAAIATSENASEYVPGPFPGDQALRFGGSGVVKTGAAVADSGTFTIEAWVRVGSGGGALFGWREAEELQEVAVVVEGDRGADTGFVTATVFDQPGGGIALQHPVDIRDSRWHHVALVMRFVDYSGYRPQVSLIVDGSVTEPEAERFNRPDLYSVNSSALDLYIGAINDFGRDPGDPDPTPPLDGAIAELAVRDEGVPSELLQRRGWPVVPTLRFDLSTDEAGPVYGYPDLRLIAGNDAATSLSAGLTTRSTAVSQFDCWGLWTPCDGYVGYWRFDDSDPSRARDRSGPGADLVFEFATAEQEQSERVAGPLGGAIRFDGSVAARSGRLTSVGGLYSQGPLQPDGDVPPPDYPEHDVQVSLEVLYRGESPAGATEANQGALVSLVTRAVPGRDGEAVDRQSCRWAALTLGSSEPGLEEPGARLRFDSLSCSLTPGWGAEIPDEADGWTSLIAELTLKPEPADPSLFVDGVEVVLEVSALDGDAGAPPEETEDRLAARAVHVEVGGLLLEPGGPEAIELANTLVGDIAAVRLMSGRLEPAERLHFPETQLSVGDANDETVFCLPVGRAEF